MRCIGVAMALAIFTNSGFGQEITLFSRHFAHVAYIDVKDSMTIYLWNGQPVGYIADSSIWGFNGHHFGWFDKGFVRDHHGFAVGCVKNAVPMPDQLEPLKGAKGSKPLKGEKTLAPGRPANQSAWSSMSLNAFFRQ